jgi:transcription antitermination protein NusB
VAELKALEGFEDSDKKLAETLVSGVRSRAAELQDVITPHLDREFARLSPVERAILYIGSYELSAQPRTPFKVVLNEAIELGKSFGGTEGHRFVNGVLEKIAASLRPEEVARSRNLA